jgi:hypothetical protein
MGRYEEYKMISQFWGWVALIVFSILILGWGMVLMYIIPDTPHHWDFGTVPDTPAQSVYSTSPLPREVNVPRQIEQLPGTGWDRTKGAQL